MLITVAFFFFFVILNILQSLSRLKKQFKVFLHTQLWVINSDKSPLLPLAKMTTLCARLTSDLLFRKLTLKNRTEAAAPADTVGLKCRDCAIKKASKQMFFEIFILSHVPPYSLPSNFFLQKKKHLWSSLNRNVCFDFLAHCAQTRLWQPLRAQQQQ